MIVICQVISSLDDIIVEDQMCDLEDRRVDADNWERNFRIFLTESVSYRMIRVISSYLRISRMSNRKDMIENVLEDIPWKLTKCWSINYLDMSNLMKLD